MINRKRLAVLALLVFCCVGLVFAQGLKAQMEERGEKLLISPNGLSVIRTAVVAPVAEAVVEAPVVEPAPVAKPSLQKSVEFGIYGYKFIVAVDGNQVSLKYIDMYAESEIAYVADVMMAAVSGEAWCNPLPGTILVVAQENVAEADFDALVEKVTGIILSNF